MFIALIPLRDLTVLKAWFQGSQMGLVYSNFFSLIAYVTEKIILTPMTNCYTFYQLAPESVKK